MQTDLEPMPLRIENLYEFLDVFAFLLRAILNTCWSTYTHTYIVVS